MSLVFERKHEQKKLADLLHSKRPEFIAIYGRRRIGKTYLVRSYFQAADCEFYEFCGQHGGNMQEQLENFTDNMAEYFYQGANLKPYAQWKDAFKELTEQLKERVTKRKVVLFIDELPWLATPRSRLVDALEYIWNTKWSRWPCLKLIVCGSATSWMLKNIVYAHGGLHNRITDQIWLKPFHLDETQAYLKAQQVRFDQHQCLSLYMVIGGVPYYLDAIQGDRSASQNIDAMCFNATGRLYNEFSNLIRSLFKKPEVYIELLTLIAKNRYGVSQSELTQKAELSSAGGSFKKKIDELVACEYVKKFIPYGKEKKEQYYRIHDEYIQFYFNWLKNFKSSELDNENLSQFWLKNITKPVWNTWVGLSFESVCYKHIAQIKFALGIHAISCSTSTWRTQPAKGSSERGAQIDLLFDRADHVITLCEIRYSKEKYTINKKFIEEIMYKVSVFKEKTKTKKQILVAIITPFGVQGNACYTEYINNVITLKDLFRAKE